MASISPIWVKITDFGISKNYGGSALRTHCGTVVYQAPELLGLLPREIAGTPQSYTKNVDIWAFGAVVHEVLTSEIPFLEPAAIGDSSMDSSFPTMSTVSVDMAVLYNYCRGRPFPTKTLEDHEICLDGINFVKSLMTANPMDRVSAPDALMHSWLGGNPSCVARFDQPLQRRHADSSGIMAPTEPAAKRTRRHFHRGITAPPSWLGQLYLRSRDLCISCVPARASPAPKLDTLSYVSPRRVRPCHCRYSCQPRSGSSLEPR